MPSSTPKQAAFMRAVDHGFKPDRFKGPSRKVAHEFVKADQAVGKAIGGIVPGAMRRPMPMPMGRPMMRTMVAPRAAPLGIADRRLADANQRLAGLAGTRRTIMPTGMGARAFAKGGLSKMHFKRAADIIKKHGEPAHGVANDLADWFSEVNPRFDRQRFMEAAGVPDLDLPKTETPPVKKKRGGRALRAAREAYKKLR